MTRTLTGTLSTSPWLRKKISSLKAVWSQYFWRARRSARRVMSATVLAFARR